VYGAVAASLILDGTFFSFNGFSGDQSFRQAMILKFMEISVDGDFFFKGLPAFYPPLYYQLLALYGWLASAPAYKLLKTGSLLLYLLGPGLLYFAWSRVVSPFQAFMASLGTFVVCAFDRFIPFASPPAFIGNSLFIPWWLFYIERIHRIRGGAKFLIFGAVTGGLIFMVYPYAFFIGGLLLITKTFLWLGKSLRSRLRANHLVSNWSVMGLTALVCAVYWGPALFSILVYGSKPADQEWYHLGHPGVQFEFLTLSWAGLLSLAGLVWALRKNRAPLYRSILMLGAVTLLFYLFGSVLGSLDHPVNIPKAKEFLLFLAGPTAGLAAAAVIRTARRSSIYRCVVPVVAGLLLLVFMNQFNGFARSGAVKKARSETVPDFGLDTADAASYKGSVFLTANSLLPSFCPVYMFIVANQHYAHPASRYVGRYELLYLLQEVQNPWLFHTVLTHNVFDHIDFFQPRLSYGRFEIPLLLNNYPDRLRPVTLSYDRRVVEDRTLFLQENNEHLYRILDPVIYNTREALEDAAEDTRDRMAKMFRWRLVARSLDSSGRRSVAEYLHTDWSRWRDLMGGAKAFRIDPQLEMIACQAAEEGDSTFFMQAFRVSQDQTTDYKLFFHLYGQSEEQNYYNYDFWPQRRTSTWKKGDIVLCCRGFPTPREDCKFILGFYHDDERRGTAFNGRL